MYDYPLEHQIGSTSGDDEFSKALALFTHALLQRNSNIWHEAHCSTLCYCTAQFYW